MLPFFVEQYGNPHSRTHLYGWQSEEAVEIARARVARLIGADPKEVLFTSVRLPCRPARLSCARAALSAPQGATESNNMAIKGIAHFYREQKRHVITSQTDHKCVLDSCRHLQQEGWDVTYLPVKPSGLVDLKELEVCLRCEEAPPATLRLTPRQAAMRPDTALVSIMAVNNEIGVLQPLAAIGALCRSKRIFFHTDAAQAAGKVPLDVNAMQIDAMSISGHKVRLTWARLPAAVRL